MLPQCPPVNWLSAAKSLTALGGNRLLRAVRQPSTGPNRPARRHCQRVLVTRLGAGACSPAPRLRPILQVPEQTLRNLSRHTFVLSEAPTKQGAVDISPNMTDTQLSGSR